MEQINITLIKDEAIESEFAAVEPKKEGQPAIAEAPMSFGMPKLLPIVAVGAIAKKGLDLAKKGFDLARKIERDNQRRTDALRNLGGSGFSTNTIGNRYDIIGRRIGGESVAYSK